MDKQLLKARIAAEGQQFFARLKNQKSSLLSMKYWVGKLMDWGMGREGFKQKLFGLIEQLPELESDRLLFDYLRKHFLSPEIPAFMRLGLKFAGLFGALGCWIVSFVVRSSIKIVAKQFIIGSGAADTVKTIKKLRGKNGYAFTLDVLGEETASEANVDAYVKGYLDFLEQIQTVLPNWDGLGDDSNNLDWGDSPIVNISVKPSALCVNAEETEPAQAVETMLARLKPIYRKVVEVGGFLCIDMETVKLREVILELYRRLRSDSEFRHHPHLAFVLQVYLKDYDTVLDDMLNWARSQSLPIAIRLVKGAYWDSETALAKAKNEPSPLFEIKAESDVAFERAAEKILRNSDICHLACASHNVRSVVAVAETARMLKASDNRLEFQVLFGMAEPFRKAIRQMTPRVRLYCPYGNLLNGMAYLVRRLIENSSNESFLKMTLAEDANMERLLEDPRVTLERETKQPS